METFIKLIDVISKLAWPALAAIILWKLYPALKTIIEARGFTVELGGMKLSVQEASDQIRKQIQDLQEKLGKLREEVNEPLKDEPKNLLAVQDMQIPKRILWVDDVPSNNAYETAKLQDDGYDIIQATSTTDAMSILVSSKQKIGLVISDMGRKEEGEYRPKAGLMLIKAIRDAGIGIPIFVYSSSNYAQRGRREVLDAGGNGITSSPVELFALIDKAIAKGTT